MKLKFKGEYYNCGEFIAKTGDVVEVPEEKAVQLLSDFPSEWEKKENGTESKAEQKAEIPAMEKAEGTEVSKDNKKGTLKNRK